MPYLRRCDVQRRHSEERLPLANRSHPFLRSHYLHVLLLDGTSRCRGRERYVSRLSLQRKAFVLFFILLILIFSHAYRNSVERLLHYGNQLEAEAPAVIEDSRPPENWPASGAIEFKKVFMSYRPDLPPVLKGMTLSVGAGERIGVVGR